MCCILSAHIFTYVPGFTIRLNDALACVSTLWHVYVPIFSSVGLWIDKVWLYRPLTTSVPVVSVDTSFPLRVHRVTTFLGFVLHITNIVDWPSVTTTVFVGRYMLGGSVWDPVNMQNYTADVYELGICKYIDTYTHTYTRNTHTHTHTYKEHACARTQTTSIQHTRTCANTHTIHSTHTQHMHMYTQYTHIHTQHTYTEHGTHIMGIAWAWSIHINSYVV